MSTDLRNALHNARRQLAGDALVASDIDDILRDAEERIGKLLMDATVGMGDEIMMALEEARGVAGRVVMDAE